MTGNEYQKLAARTIDKELNERGIEAHALHGISSEVGEIHALYQKIFQGHVFDPKHLKKEIGDLLWFVAELCTSHGWSLEDVMTENIEKLIKRYPDGFDVERSLHREIGDI